MLFNEYPDNFFSLLHCKYQYMYADILLRLYNLFYGPDALSQPLREDVRGMIAAAIEQRGIVEWEEELSGDPKEMDDLDLDDVNYRAYLIYRRLIECGWIEEERDNDFRDIVSMPYYAAAVLGVLRDASLGRRVSYAGYVGNVYLQLSHLKNNPHEASFLKEARRNSEELLKKLQELFNSVKSFIRQTKEKKGVAEVLGHFFGNYMENFFSGAYGRVKTVDNPFKYRHRILEMLIEFRHDKELLNRIAEVYGPGNMLADVLDDLDAIYNVFSRLDGEIARIDLKKEQYERIVREQVRYFDAGQGEMTGAVASLLKAIGEDPQIGAAFQTNLKVVSLIDSESLSTPRKASKTMTRQKVSDSELSGSDYEIERLKAARRMASSVGRVDVVGFIDMMLRERPEILGSEMSIKDLKELTCMLLSRYAATDMPAFFRVENIRKEAENRYLRFEEFRIGKKVI